jgi:hypothetical protein
MTADLAVSRRDEDRQSTFETYSLNYSSLETSLDEWNVDYSLGGVAHLPSQLHVQGDFGQRFREVDTKSYRVSRYLDSTVVKSESSSSQSSRQADFNLRVDWITQGEFDPYILLDDYPTRQIEQETLPWGLPQLSSYRYQSFYHGMLFRNQSQITAQLYFTELELIHQTSRSTWGVQLAPTYGISNHFEVGMNYNYQREKSMNRSGFEQYYVITSALFMGKYRSYEYRRGEGPGWNRDSADDIVFGAYPEFGQVYAALSIVPPKFGRRSFESLSLFTFSDLVSDKKLEWTLNLALGLGRRIVVHAAHRETYIDLRVESREFIGRVSGRILDNVELWGSYEHAAYRSHFSPEPRVSRAVEPLISVGVKALI